MRQQKETFFILPLIFILGFSAVNQANAAWLEQKDKTKMQNKNDNWTIEYAIELMKQSANISYGIQNVTLFNKILAQKDKGDPNALFVYAYLLKNFNVINERVGLSRKEANAESFNIYWELSEKGHPQACDELLAIGNSDALQYRKITREQLLEKQKKCIKVALKHQLTEFETYADILFFELEKDNYDRLLLNEKQTLNHSQYIKQAIKLYVQGAKETGSVYYLARTVEAYYDGIGLEKDKIKAAAWAKLVTDRTRPHSIYRTVNHARELNEQFSQDPEIQNSPEFKKLYEELQATIPVFKY